MKESLYDFYKRIYTNKDIFTSRKKRVNEIIVNINNLLESLENMTGTQHFNIMDYISISKELKLLKNKMYLDINDYVICEHYIIKKYKRHKVRCKNVNIHNNWIISNTF